MEDISRTCDKCGFKEVQKGDVFCHKCGEALEGYCRKCGLLLSNKKCVKCIVDMSRQQPSSSRQQTQTLSLEDFTEAKGKQRVGFKPRKSAIKNTPQPVKQKNVTIKVGLILSDDNGELKVKRGSKVSVSVPCDINAENLCKAAVEKHSALDQYFCGLETYLLLYPDQKLVHTLPGSEKLFTLSGYKNFLAKSYSKIELYLCTQSNFLLDLSSENPDVSKELSNEAPTSELNQDMFSTIPTDDIFLRENLTDYDQPSCSSHIPNKPEDMVRCPMCSKIFGISIIETHVDDCMEDRKNYIANYDNQEHDAEGTDDCNSVELYNGDSNNETSMLVDKNEQDIREQLKNVLSKCEVNTLSVHLIVTRRSSFKDFHKFFSKPWNMKKPCGRYTVRFVGEEGIDDGGISREFYSGM